MYRDQAKDFGYEASGEQLGWAAPIYVAETQERAREEAARRQTERGGTEKSHSTTSGEATTEKRSEEQERERSEETRLESWRCCEARRDLLKERSEESRPRTVAAKPPGAFELRTSGSTSGLARGDCRGPAAYWLTPEPIRVFTCKKLETYSW